MMITKKRRINRMKEEELQKSKREGIREGEK